MDWDILRKRHLKDTAFFNKRGWNEETQALLLIQLGELLQKGFSIYDAVGFSQILFKDQLVLLEQMQSKLAKGYRIDESLAILGYSEQICSQIYLAQQHGDLAKSLMTIGLLLTEKQKQRKKLIQAIIYPISLFCFIVGLMIAIRKILLPQILLMVSQEALANNHLASGVIFFLTYLPQICGVVVGGMLLLVGYLFLKIRALSKMARLNFLMKIPIVNSFIKQYYTFLYAREFAYFLANGQSLLQMIDAMNAKGTSQLTKEIAEKLEAEFRHGNDMAQALQKIVFFKEELIWLVMQATLTSQLDVKLLQYSKKLLTDFIKDIERKISWVQPILFIIIGLMIVSIYLVLLLPTVTTLKGGNF